MLAVLLYLWLGRQAALAELLAELVIGVALLGGGGRGRRVVPMLPSLLARPRRRRAAY
jgi:hypothetical protein